MHVNHQYQSRQITQLPQMEVVRVRTLREVFKELFLFSPLWRITYPLYYLPDRSRSVLLWEFWLHCSHLWLLNGLHPSRTETYQNCMGPHISTAEMLLSGLLGIYRNSFHPDEVVSHGLLSDSDWYWNPEPMVPAPHVLHLPFVCEKTLAKE